MKALFIGGIKSGKSFLAEQYAMKNAKIKPVYLATTEFIDGEMNARIESHKKQRGDSFITVEESLQLNKIISQSKDLVLLECLSMWINNMLYHKFNFSDIKEEIENIMEQDKDVVFVLNDVGSGIIPDNELARQYIDISGKISQVVAQGCDEVFHVIAGIGTKIK
ncbi:MAG: bifunctional adenosylcobinamide kinase/adenosylcobinamide-phosphate guanylyltransferase [Campylobacterota bacterium]